MQSVRPPARSSIAGREPCTPIERAIEDVVRLTQELTSAIGGLAYAEAARARSELERALSLALVVAKALPRLSLQVLALHRVYGLRAVAAPQLTIAPTPSSVAIKAARAGDTTAWNQEEQAWTVVRLVSGSSAVWLTGEPFAGPLRAADRTVAYALTRLTATNSAVETH